MGTAEIIAQLPNLKPSELAQIQAKLDELAGEFWLDNGELSDAEKAVLNAELAAYEKDPAAGDPWEQVKARVSDKLRS